jgi:hypothetical protein
MNQRQWLKSDNPAAMLNFLRDRADERKARLFVCGCARALWEDLSPQSRRMLQVAEEFADDPDPAVRRRMLDAGAEASYEPFEDDEGPAPSFVPASLTRTDQARIFMGNRLARLAAYARIWNAVPEMFVDAFNNRFPTTGWVDEVRCVFGNPFRPARADPAWPAWNGGTVRRLAESVYAGRAFDRLPVLADALEDAGCADADLLGHLRGPGPHARGCWAVDLLLDDEGRRRCIDRLPGSVWVGMDPKNDFALQHLRREVEQAGCPGCSVSGRRVAHRVRKEGPNRGRLFVKCEACDRFDWHGPSPAPPAVTPRRPRSR